MHMLKDFQFAGIWIDTLKTSVKDSIDVYVAKIAKLERAREKFLC